MNNNERPTLTGAGILGATLAGEGATIVFVCRYTERTSGIVTNPNGTGLRHTSPQ